MASCSGSTDPRRKSQSTDHTYCATAYQQTVSRTTQAPYPPWRLLIGDWYIETTLTLDSKENCPILGRFPLVRAYAEASVGSLLEVSSIDAWKKR